MPREAELTINLLKKKKGPIIPPKHLIKRVQGDTKIKNAIKKVLIKEPKNIPSISKETGIDMYTVSWYVATFIRYGYVKIVGKDDEGYTLFVWGEG